MSNLIYAKRPPKIYQDGRGFWYNAFYDKTRSPKKKRVATHIKTDYRPDYLAHIPQEVQDLHTDLKRLYFDKKFDPWTDDAPELLRVKESIPRFLAYLKDEKEARTETLKSYRTTLCDFERGLTPGLHLDRVRSSHVSDFIYQIGLRSGTSDTYLNRLRAFFKWALEKRHIWRNPTDGVKRPKVRHEEKVILRPQEFDRVLTAIETDPRADPVIRDAIEFAGATAMRLNELISRQWKHVDLVGGTIEVCDTPNFQVKNSLPARRVGLMPRAMSILARRQALRRSESDDELIFIAPKGGKVGDDWLSKRFKHFAVEVSGLSEKLRFHNLRDTGITYLLAAEVPPTVVMKHVGHKKLETTMQYTHILDDMLRDMAAFLLVRWMPGYTHEEPLLRRQMAAWLMDMNESDLKRGHQMATKDEWKG